MIAVVYIFSFFLAALGALLLIAGVLSGAAGETEVAPALFISAALWIFVAGAINMALRGRERRLKPRQRFLLVSLVFLVLPVFAAVPILIAVPDAGFVNAYFEAVSGLTTTGWSALGDTEALPLGIVLWRAQLQWLGGGIVLLVVIFVLAPARVGGLPDSQAGPLDHVGAFERQRLLFALWRVVPLYVAFSSLCFVLLTVTGTAPFDAFVLASAAVATSAFTAQAGELGSYVNDPGIWIITVFSTVSAASFLWLRRLLRANRTALQHRESFYLLAIVIALGLVMSLLIYSGTGSGIGAALRDGFSTAAAVITTSGLEARAGGMLSLPYALLLILILVGGASFSTAGGIKMFRVGAMAVQSTRELVRLVYPHAIRAARFGTQAYNIQIMKAIWSLLFAALVAAGLGAAAFGVAGLPLDQALLGGFGAVSNMAVPLSPEPNTTLAFAAIPDGAKLVLCLIMAAGRVELLILLSVLFAPLWRG